MELRYLEIFCEVVEQKSFSKAAANLNLTQPTVSIHIKNLEDEFSVKFLNRLGRTVSPTREGDILYSYARNIVKLKKEATLAIEGFSGDLKGLITVGASTVPGEYLLPNLIGKFIKKYPKVHPVLRVGNSKDIYESVLGGDVDIGIVGTYNEDSNIISKKFKDDEIVLAAPKSFEKDNIPLKELCEIPLLSREQGSGTWETITDTLSTKGIEEKDLNLVGKMGSTQSHIQAVLAGIGFAFISKRAILSAYGDRRIKIVKVKGLSVLRKFHLITHKQRYSSNALKTFKSFLLK